MVMAAIAAASALASAGAGIAGVDAANAQRRQQAGLAAAQMQADQNNQQYQRMVQAMVNNRAVAGTTDSFGTSTVYDPTTNTWKQTLGALPQAADTAAMNANLTRNTTDLMQQELANRVSMQRAAEAGGAADTARRNLANFRPMSADELTGLLTQQGVEAAREAYDPLRGDVLRSTARTGTAAGPVVRQLGLGEAQNLRNTLIDSRIAALNNVAGINTSNYNRLLSAASGENALATPQLNQGGLGTSANDQLIQSLTQQRANFAPTSTAQGAMGPNYAQMAGNTGANLAASMVAPTGSAFGQAASGLKDLSNMAGGVNSGTLKGLWSSIFGNNPGSSYDPSSQGYTAGGSGTDALQSMGFFTPLSDSTNTNGGQTGWTYG